MTQQPKDDKGFFVQFPINLISGCPDLTRDDKWVLLSLMQDHRTDGPFKLSFRSISIISGVPLRLLSSYVDKKDVKHEGIMERIERVTGYVHCEKGKEIDPATGKTKGNAQSYITINYTKIWQDNRMYSEVKKNRPVSNTNTLFEPVHNEVKPVSNTNTLVPIQNTPVSNTNGSVPYTNEPVSNSRSKYPPKIDKIITDIQITEEEREESDVPSTSPCIEASSLTHSSTEVSFSSEGTQGSTTTSPASVGVSHSSHHGGDTTVQPQDNVALLTNTSQLLTNGAIIPTNEQHSSSTAPTSYSLSSQHDNSTINDPVTQVDTVQVRETIRKEVRDVNTALEASLQDTEVLKQSPQVVMAVETPRMDEVVVITQEIVASPTGETMATMPIKAPRIDEKAPDVEKQGKGRAVKKQPQKRDLFAEAPLEVQAVITEWRSIFTKPVPVTQTLVDHATTLAECVPDPGEIAACRLWMYKTDRKKWYSTHGMHLGDVVTAFPKFRSLGNIPTNGTDKGRKFGFDHIDSNQLSFEKEFYPTKEPQQKEKVHAF